MDQPPSDSFLDTWPGHLVTAALTGVTTAYMPVHRWSPVARWTMHGGMGALTGAATAFVASRPAKPSDTDDDTPSAPLRPATAAAIGLALAVAIAAVSRGGEAADAGIERALTRRGVRRPRLWMGVAAAGASLAMSVVEGRGEAASPLDGPAPGDLVT